MALQNEHGVQLWLSEPIAPNDHYYHGIDTVLTRRKTAYQELLIAETSAYGKALVLDGRWQSAVGDEFFYHEPLVHPACVFHGRPQNVLILGGGEGATLREVLRWTSIQQAVMVDIDAEVIEACKIHLPEMHQGAFDDPRSNLVITDALDYLKTTDRQFDVVISDLSDPIESGPSFRLFTKETFEQIKGVLAPHGYLVVQAGPVGPVDLQLHVRLASTLDGVFGHVASYSSFVPSFLSPWGFLLASVQPLDTRPVPEQVNQLLKRHLINTGMGLRMFDGTTLLGMLQAPRHIRQAIKQETQL